MPTDESRPDPMACPHDRPCGKSMSDQVIDGWSGYRVGGGGGGGGGG